MESAEEAEVELAIAPESVQLGQELIVAVAVVV